MTTGSAAPLRATLLARRALRTGAILQALALVPACAAAEHQRAGATAAPPPEDASPIETDRPGFLYSTALVPERALQLEAGLPLVALDDAGEGASVLTSLPLQLRYGLCAALELRAGAAAYNWLSSDAGPDERGAGDLELGLKLPLALPFGQDSAALIAGLRLPTGERAFGVDGPAPALNAVAAWAATDELSVKGMAGLSYLPLDGPDPLVGSIAGLVSRSLGSGWTLALEALFLPAQRAADTAFAGLWTSKALSGQTQLDCSIHRGLNEETVEWLLGIGVSVRR